MKMANCQSCQIKIGNLQYPETNRGKIVSPMPMTEFLVGSVRTSLWLVMAAVATLLAIGAVKLAGLLLARTTARRQELALRGALGAGRGRLAAQLVTEGLVLAVAGGVLGVAAAVLTHRLLLQAVPDSVPRTADLSLRWPLVLLGAGLSVVVGLICGDTGVASDPEPSGSGVRRVGPRHRGRQ